MNDNELIEVYDKDGDFLFSAMSEQEAEILCCNAIREGFHPCRKEDYENELGE